MPRRLSKQQRVHALGRSLDIRIMAVDPAFRFTGWVLIELMENGERLQAVGLIKTEKSDKKRKILVCDDNHRRSSEIATALHTAMVGFNPHVVCAESLVGSRNASSAVQQGMGWGVLSAVVTVNGIPILQNTPQGVKKSLCGSKAATKEEIEDAVVKRYPEARTIVESAINPPSVREHVYDAIAVAISCLGASEIQTLRRMALLGGQHGNQAKA
jgi:crossover junction endodeoxyribonuclease RuvC